MGAVQKRAFAVCVQRLYSAVGDRIRHGATVRANMVDSLWISLRLRCDHTIVKDGGEHSCTSKLRADWKPSYQLDDYEEYLSGTYFHAMMLKSRLRCESTPTFDNHDLNWHAHEPIELFPVSPLLTLRCIQLFIVDNRLLFLCVYVQIKRQSVHCTLALAFHAVSSADAAKDLGDP